MAKKVICLLLLVLLMNVGWVAAETGQSLTKEEAVEIAWQNSRALEKAEMLLKQREKDLDLYQNKYNRHYNLLLGNQYTLFEKEDANKLEDLNRGSSLELSKELSPINRISLKQHLLNYDDGFNFLEQGSLKYEHRFFSEYDSRSKYQKELFAREVALFKQQQEVEELKAEIKYDVINNYYQILEVKANKKLQQQSLSQAEEMLELVESQFKAGEALALDKAEAELEVENRQLALERLLSQFELALLELADSLKTELSPEISFSKAERIEFPYSRKELQKVARENNSQIKILDQELTKEKKELEYLTDKRDFTLQAVGEVAWSDEEFADDYQLGIEFNYNLNSWQKKSDQIEISAQKLQLAKLEADLLIKEEVLELELQQEYFKLQDYKREIDFNQREIENSIKALKIAEQRYQRGNITLNDLISEQLNLLEKELNYVENTLKYNLQAYNLKRLIGEF